MAVNGEEIRPRSVTNEGVVRTYRIYEAVNEADVATFIATLPATVAGWPFSGYTAEEDPDVLEEYDARVSWGNISSNPEVQPGESGYRFSFQAPSAHIKRALATISETEDPAIFSLGPPPMHGAINVVDYGTADVHVEGFDLQPPPEVFTIPYTDLDAVITSGYQATVRGLCGKVNSSSFLGLAAGQVMLVRADGQRTNGLWNLEFGFGYIPNATSIPVGDNIVVAAKDGMDLLWALDVSNLDNTVKSLISQPGCAYVVRVWERADLNGLALP